VPSKVVIRDANLIRESRNYDRSNTKMEIDYDVAIVGGGIMGLACARALGEYRKRICCFEQFTLGHARGSSHGNARIFKLCYPDSNFVRLAKRSLKQWRELERESGEEILCTHGSIDVASSEEIHKRCQAMTRCDISYELVSGSAITDRYGLAVSPRADAVFQEHGAVLHADRAQQVLLAAARAMGVELRDGTSVRNLEVSSGCVRVLTDQAEFAARSVIVTAGAWVRSVVKPLGMRPNVVATRETVVYVPRGTFGTLPTFSDWRQPSHGEVFYGLVTRDGTLKVGLSGSGTITDPDQEGRIDDKVVRYASEWAAKTFGVDLSAGVQTDTCLYTNAPRQRFLIRRKGRVVVGSACSGHGFKFAPAIGRRLASLALQATFG
jgi:sarcosine oxidase